MKLYLLYEDAYEDEYGCELHAYGIFTSKANAEKMKETLLKKASDPWKKRFTMMIDEFESDKYTDDYLGGYIE